MERIVVVIAGSDAEGWSTEVDGRGLPFRVGSRAAAGRLAVRELAERDMPFEQRRLRAVAQYGEALAIEDPRRAA
jgi:hypothetical protein